MQLSRERKTEISLDGLYAIFQSTPRRLILRTLGPQDIDDKVHDCFLIVLKAIRSGEIRDPERLMGFVRTVVRRYIIHQIHASVSQRKRMVDSDLDLMPARDSGENPEQAAITKQQMEFADRAFSAAAPADRDVLRRFYIDEQPKERICREMRLTGTQFALLKSRARARVAKRYSRLAALKAA